MPTYYKRQRDSGNRGETDQRTQTRSTPGRRSRFYKTSKGSGGEASSSLDLDSAQGLRQLAELKGLSGALDQFDEEEEEKLSIIERLSVGLGAFNPAEAIARDSEGAGNFLLEYPKTVLSGIASALTGDDIGDSTKRRFFSDILQQSGWENKYERFGVGLLGDIFLDPSTFLGGSAARLTLKGAGKVGGKVVAKAAKVSPRGAAAVGAGVKTFKDAFGNLLVHGYATTDGLTDDAMRLSTKKGKVLRDLAKVNLERYGTKSLAPDQAEEFVSKLLQGKQAEFGYFGQVEREMIELFNKEFPSARFPLKDPAGAIRRMETLQRQIPKRISRLQALRKRLAQPLMVDDLAGYHQTISDLRKEIADLAPVAKEAGEKAPKKVFGKPEIDAGLMNAMSFEKDGLANQILALRQRLAKMAAEASDEVATNAGKGVGIDPAARLTRQERIAEITGEITKLTNEMFRKESILENVTKAKSLAKDRIKTAFESGNFSKLPEELAVALRPTSTDPVVKEAIEQRLTRNKKLAELAQVEDPFTVYFPSLKKDSLQDFFSKTSGFKVGSEGYRREYKNLLKDEELLKTPADAFFRVEAEAVTNAMNRDFQKRVLETYGKAMTEFAGEEAAKKAGFRLLREKGIYGKELGYLPEADWKFLNGMIGDNYAAIDAIAKASGFDAATSLFKRWVTGLFAPFHVRNFVSGTIQNYEVLGRHALKAKNIATGQRIATRLSQGTLKSKALDDIEDPLLRGLNFDVDTVPKFGNENVILGKKQYRINDIAEAIEDRFGGSSYYQTEFNTIVHDANLLEGEAAFSKAVLKDWGKNFKSLTLKKNPLRGLVTEDAPYFRAARVIGNWVEMQQKSTAVVAALDKGLTMNQALKAAEKAGFDYRALTQFESKILRRIIPFYSFNRKNVELQLKTLKENPQRINQIIRGVDNVQNLFDDSGLTDEEKENLPAYLKEYLATPVGRNAEGVSLFIRNFGTPIEAFAELVRPTMEGHSGIERTFLATLSKVNPYLKVPIELGIGKDSFRQRDIKDVYDAKEFELAPQIVKDWLRLKPINRKVFGTNRTRTVYVADPERLLVARSLFTSRGFTYMNNIFNNDAPTMLKIMDLVSGIRVTEVDIERQKSWRERQKWEEFGGILRRHGVVSEFNKLYIPKDK